LNLRVLRGWFSKIIPASFFDSTLLPSLPSVKIHPPAVFCLRPIEVTFGKDPIRRCAMKLDERGGPRLNKVVGFPPLSAMYIIYILTLIFWIFMLVDCLKNPQLKGNEKILWVLVIIFTYMIGALLYLFIGRARRS
jgi:Phospholipase_D-nuclease N-terminal